MSLQNCEENAVRLFHWIPLLDKAQTLRHSPPFPHESLRQSAENYSWFQIHSRKYRADDFQRVRPRTAHPGPVFRAQIGRASCRETLRTEEERAERKDMNKTTSKL